MPLVSVIIPVYNMERYLVQCIDSVLAQTMSDLELILVDDGSTDGSGALCDDYGRRDARVAVIHMPANGGVSAARNAGIEKATGEYIMFVDSDDWVEADMIKVLYSNCVDNRCEMSSVLTVNEYRNGSIVPRQPFDDVRLDARESIFYEIFNDNMTNGSLCNKLFIRSAFDGLQIVGLTICEDLITLLYLVMKINTAYFSSYIGYHYRQRKFSGVRNFDIRNIEDVIGEMEKIERYLSEHQPRLLPSFNYKKSLSYFHMCTASKKEVFLLLKKQIKSYYRNHKDARFAWKYRAINLPYGLFNTLYGWRTQLKMGKYDLWP